ncbi:MAG: SBBP repeat-containing protein, partial [Anaerolineae bacterium]|nr:SBBP repeat-containing protein [Anaerolineae bacterium]MDW8072006.1 SBBP repeat-containing protein [Anaerolineae bacterium]
MSRSLSHILVAVVILVLAAGVLPAQAHTDQWVAGSADAHTAAAYGSLPLLFVENRGQVAEAVRYYLLGGERTVYLTEDAIWVTVRQATTRVPQERAPWRVEKMGKGVYSTTDVESRAVALRLSFPGANPDVRLEPLEALETRVSYFIGNDPSKWHTDVPVWGGVRYAELYPGIDLEVSGHGGMWTWQVHTRPGADLSAVQLRVEGAERLALEGDHLWVTTALGTFRLPLLMLDEAVVPLARVEGTIVRAPFATPGAGAAAIPAADRPGDLLYGTFLGGGGEDWGLDIAVDNSGSAYITGYTRSSDFPTTPGSYDSGLNDEDVFVVKLSASGTSLEYATFLGGSAGEVGKGIAVDADGNAYIMGHTDSSNFPTTPGSFDRELAGSYDARDAFVAKLNANGTTLLYSTYLGGSGFEDALDFGDIAIDGSGYAYVIGLSNSYYDFPTTPGSFDRTPYSSDTFVVKLNPQGSNLIYSTFLGGNGNCEGAGIAVDSSGNAYVTGRTYSANFPTTPGSLDRVFDGGEDGFVVKLNANGSNLIYATFLGGGSMDEGWDIAVDSGGKAYVTGRTWSSDFPKTTGSYDPSHNYGDGDAFVVKLNASGSGLEYGTFLGGGELDGSYGIAVDSNGNAYVTGVTNSSNFPATIGPGYDNSFNGGLSDVFVAKLSADGRTLMYATYMGTGGRDVGERIAIDSTG